MSRKGSEDMLGLLKELSVYKAMDEDYLKGSQGQLEAAAFEDRGRRRQEIGLEMLALAAESQKNPS